ncbi:MAG: hypothetical protein QXT53_02315 [Ignisphaera sp.]
MKICVESSLSRRILIFNILAMLTLFALTIEAKLLASDILNVFIVIVILASVTLFIILRQCSTA